MSALAEAAAPPRKTRAQIDADIERLIKALAAACAYDTQLHHAVEGAFESKEALYVAAQQMLTLQHRLGDDLTVSNGFASLKMKTLADLVDQLRAHQQAIKELRASIEGELAMLRTQAKRKR